jgi:oligopeptide transport system permease protein
MIVLAVMVLAALSGPMADPLRLRQVTKTDVWMGPLHRRPPAGNRLARPRPAGPAAGMGLGVSLAIGVVATSVSLVIGVAWGAVAGYLSAGIDEVMMRIVDTLYSLPFIFFVILLMVTFGGTSS